MPLRALPIGSFGHYRFPVALGNLIPITRRIDDYQGNQHEIYDYYSSYWPVGVFRGCHDSAAIAGCSGAGGEVATVAKNVAG